MSNFQFFISQYAEYVKMINHIINNVELDDYRIICLYIASKLEKIKLCHDEALPFNVNKFISSFSGNMIVFQYDNVYLQKKYNDFIALEKLNGNLDNILILTGSRVSSFLWAYYTPKSICDVYVMDRDLSTGQIFANDTFHRHLENKDIDDFFKVYFVQGYLIMSIKTFVSHLILEINNNISILNERTIIHNMNIYQIKSLLYNNKLIYNIMIGFYHIYF